MSSFSLRVYLCPKEIRAMVDKKKVEKGIDKTVSGMLEKADNSAHGQVE